MAGPKKNKRPGNAAAAAAKRERRADRQKREAAAKAAAARKATLRKVGIGIGSLIAIAAVAFAIVATGGAEELEGVERPDNRGSSHLDVGQAASYETATPTSGEHAPTSAQCGILSGGLPLVFAVHNLEHGVIVVWYRPDLEAALLPALSTLISRWDSHVIVAPNPGIEEPIVATAWNRLMRFDAVGEDLAEFIDVYRERGLEQVPCPIQL